MEAGRVMVSELADFQAVSPSSDADTMSDAFFNGTASPSQQSVVGAGSDDGGARRVKIKRGGLRLSQGDRDAHMDYCALCLARTLEAGLEKATDTARSQPSFVQLAEVLNSMRSIEAIMDEHVRRSLDCSNVAYLAKKCMREYSDNVLSVYPDFVEWSEASIRGHIIFKVMDSTEETVSESIAMLRKIVSTTFESAFQREGNNPPEVCPKKIKTFNEALKTQAMYLAMRLRLKQRMEDPTA